MRPDKKYFDALDVQLAQIIETVTAKGLTETAALLRMVKLDLKTRANGITTDELEALIYVARQGAYGLDEETPAHKIN